MNWKEALVREGKFAIHITILFSPHLVSPPWWNITLSMESFIYKVYDYKATYVFSKMYTKSQQYVLCTWQVARYSVNTAHPYFVNQLFSSVDPYGLVGQWLTDALNPSVYTFEVAPVFTLMEEEVLREMRAIVGWPDNEGDGIFCPGGSVANGYAISCARFHFYPEIKVSVIFLCFAFTVDLLLSGY